MNIGYADVDYILSQLPESKQVESELESYNNQLTNQIQAKYQEYQDKLAAYQKAIQQGMLPDERRKAIEKELSDLGNSIPQFEQEAQISSYIHSSY